MAHRSKDWNQNLAESLKDRAFAQAFVIASLDEGLPLQIVMGKVIRAYGVSEYARTANMASPNVLRAVDPNHNPTYRTLNQLLTPLGLKLSAAPMVAEDHAA